MKLFDYIKVLFGRDQQWNKLKGYDKSKNSFMTNRFMSIKFPIQANMFNTLKIDPVGQAESWRLISSKFNRVPGFIYTKVKKTPKQKAKEWKANNHDKVIQIQKKWKKKNPEKVRKSQIKNYLKGSADIKNEEW